MTRHRSPSLFQSFNHAAEGIVHAVRTQRNLWIHFAVAVVVLVAAVGFGATKLELAVLLLAITFVLVAELVNTAVEAAVDVASTSFDPLAKIAKDIAAGAVLVAALNAVAVGYLVFSGEVATRSSRFLTRLSDAPAELTLVALAVTVIIVIAVKAYTGRGTPLRGGLPSGHAAVAFAGWMAVTLILDGSVHRFLISSVTFIMALLVAELVNTAVEAAVDVASTAFDPMAKLAKDMAAGAVLVAALNAVAIGYLVFSGEVATRSSRFLTRLSDAPAELTLVALAVTVIIVIAIKAYTGRGTPLRGGLPSGHAAVAFAGWMAVTLILANSNHRFLISSLTFIMALLVAQTRVETGVHSTSEVASGGVLGALVTLLLFQAFG